MALHLEDVEKVGGKLQLERYAGVLIAEVGDGMRSKCVVPQKSTALYVNHALWDGLSPSAGRGKLVRWVVKSVLSWEIAAPRIRAAARDAQLQA